MTESKSSYRTPLKAENNRRTVLALSEGTGVNFAHVGENRSLTTIGLRSFNLSTTKRRLQKEQNLTRELSVVEIQLQTTRCDPFLT
jgi:hypothetical protein